MDAAAELDRRRLPGGRGRWRIFAGVWLVYLAPGFQQAWTDYSGSGRVVRLALLVAFCWVYLDLVARALTGADRLRWIAPGLLAALSAVLAALSGPTMLGLVIYVVVTVAVLLPPRVGVGAAVAGVLLVGLLPLLVPGWRAGHEWLAAGQVALAALAALGFMALIRRTQQLRLAQEEVSRLAAERERLRIARDLHDLLGHSLTAVTVKAELARRLVGRDDARAAEEMAAVEQLARQSLADVRAAVAGYREVSLAVELATAREVFGAAGMAVDLPRAVDEVPADLRELFGWAVREGVTNAVRHSGATRVSVQVEPHAIEVVDNGHGPRPPRDGSAAAVSSVLRDGAGSTGPGDSRRVGIGGSGGPGGSARLGPGGSERPEPDGSKGPRPGGSGLAGLAERAARLGGWVQAGPASGGGYRLRVEVPPGATAGIPTLGPSAPAGGPLPAPPGSEGATEGGAADPLPESGHAAAARAVGRLPVAPRGST